MVLSRDAILMQPVVRFNADDVSDKLDRLRAEGRSVELRAHWTLSTGGSASRPIRRSSGVSREMAPQVIERVRAFIVRGIRGAVHSSPLRRPICKPA